MPEKPSDPNADVADVLERLARQLRQTRSGEVGGSGVTIAAPQSSDDGPSLGALDVFTDAHAVTVTVETRNADAASVHVSLLDGRLMIGLGEGPRAYKRDLPLPAAVDEEGAVATFRNGILDVVLPLKRS